MAIRIDSDQAVVGEAVDLLLKHMPPSKVAQLLAAWQVGGGDYLQIRDELFEGETVDSLFQDVLRTEQARPGTSGRHAP